MISFYDLFYDLTPFMIVRAHPDKGGSNEHATIINAAYAFLKPFSK